MQKIPTIFERDWDGDRSRVVNQVHPGCEWVLAGEGVATRKLDGTCCMIRDLVLFKRREIKPGQATPPGFERVEHDAETHKTVGWVPVGDGPDDQYHREALASLRADFGRPVHDGTYELIGPKIQGGVERDICEGLGHRLMRHPELTGGVSDLDLMHIAIYPPLEDRTFEGIKSYLAGKNIEGVVFHHPDGRMAKIKLRDFGLKRP